MTTHPYMTPHQRAHERNRERVKSQSRRHQIAWAIAELLEACPHHEAIDRNLDSLFKAAAAGSPIIDVRLSHLDTRFFELDEKRPEFERLLRAFYYDQTPPEEQ